MEDPRLITRVVLRNYKSIAACDISPAQLTFLVGRNGSGKSNFLDALRFLSDSLRHSLGHALRDRGGVNEVRRRSGRHPTQFGMRMEFDLGRATGHFAFAVAAKRGGGYEIEDEECVVLPRGDAPPHYYRVSSGQVKSNASPFPAPSHRRLALVGASGLPAFRPVYDAFSRSGFYNLNPAAIRTAQSPDPGDLMNRDGSNVASVLDRIAQRSPENEEDDRGVPGAGGSRNRRGGSEVRRPCRYPGVPAARQRGSASSALPCQQHVRRHTADPRPACGAVPDERGHGGRSLVGIEKPEVVLHPTASGALMDALSDAAERKQVLVTSHSADLLDEEESGRSRVLAVVSDDGITRIGPLDEVGASVIRDRLYTAGELLRMDKLEPDASLSRPVVHRSDLFGGNGLR